MAYNTKKIVRDFDGAPIPQIYNPVSDAYEPLQGTQGCSRVLLYDAAGNPLSVTSGRLDVRASELDITLSALRDALRGLDSKTLSDLATLLTAIKDTAGIKKITDTVNTDVIDRAARILGKVTADDNAIAALGALAAAAVTDPSASASVISLLKGLLKQLQGAGSGAVPTTLTGSYATIDSAPAVGAKTVSTTAAELFAGASRLANRYVMTVYNESSNPVYWGPSGVTTSSGFPLLPQDSVVFQFNPSVATAIYFIAGNDTTVRVVELA